MALIEGVTNLKAFQEAYRLILEIRPLAKSLPQTEQFNGIADQMRRASTSICANLTEGFGKNCSKTELRRFVRIAQGSAHEMDFWLKLSGDLNYIDNKIVQDLRERYNLVSRLLKGFEKSLA
jgi:four helix bundle protein